MSKKIITGITVVALVLAAHAVAQRPAGGNGNGGPGAAGATGATGPTGATGLGSAVDIKNNAGATVVTGAAAIQTVTGNCIAVTGTGGPVGGTFGWQSNLVNAAGCPGIGGVTLSETSTYQVLAADFSQGNTIVVPSGTFTITLVASGSQPLDKQAILIINYGSGVVTIARSGQNINGGTSSLTLAAASATAPTAAFIQSDGTNYFAALAGGATQASGDATTALSTDEFVASSIRLINGTASVQAGTIAVLSNTPTYSNGTAGVGATLTAGSVGALVIDGYTVLLNDRILVKNQASDLQNGIYTETTLGTGGVAYVLTRATDFDSVSKINYAGPLTINQGSTLAAQIWYPNSLITAVGTSSITFAQAAANSQQSNNGGGKATCQGGCTSGQIITGGGGSTLTASGSTLASLAPIHTFNFNVTATGQTLFVQAGNYSCSIIGWTMNATPSGTVTMDIDALTNSAWPATPAIPNTSTNKISASAPVTVSSGTSASGGSSAISTWTKGITAYMTITANVTTFTTSTSAVATVYCQ